MSDPKIAALRAASSNAPAGPSGPQALSYPWMTATGRELVMPANRTPPASPKAQPPPDPSAHTSFAQRKSKPPPDLGGEMPPENQPAGEPPLTNMDFGLLEYMRGPQFAALAPQPAAPPTPPGATDAQLNPQLLQFLRMRDSRGPGAMR
jgi:hypothetical protein